MARFDYPTGDDIPYDDWPVKQTMDVQDVPIVQPVGFVWFVKPRYRVKAGSVKRDSLAT